MIDIIRRKPNDVFSVGINAHPLIDNLITLSRSSNDLFDGVIDYIFFRVINCDPLSYSNISDEEISDEIIDEIQFNYNEFDKKYKNFTNSVLVEQIEKAIEYIRGKAIEEDRIKQYIGDLYTCEEARFNATYILKKLLCFFREVELTIPKITKEENVGKLLCLIGPSGSGKTTIIKNTIPLLSVFVSATTRAPRKGEVDGVDYYFLSKKDFEQQKENEDLIECVEYAGNYYGFLMSELEKLKYNNCITAVTYEGYLELKSHVGEENTYPIYIDTDFVKRVEKLHSRAVTIEEYEKNIERISLDEERFNEIKNKPEMIVVRNEFNIESLTEIVKTIMDMLFNKENNIDRGTIMDSFIKGDEE